MSRFGSSKRVRAEEMRVEANRCNPARDEPGVLPSGHATVEITTPTEQKFVRLLASGFEVIVDGLSRLLGQLKPDGPTCFLLPYSGAIDCIPAGCNVLDPKCDDIAASQLAVDC